MKPWLLSAMIVALYASHQDVWNWRRIEPLFLEWMTVGLQDLVGFSFAVAAVLAILVKIAWPKGFAEEPARVPSRSSDSSARWK